LCWRQGAKDNLETTATEVRSLGAEAMAFALDLRQPQSPKNIIEGTLAHFGRIDALLKRKDVSNELHS